MNFKIVERVTISKNCLNSKKFEFCLNIFGESYCKDFFTFFNLFYLYIYIFWQTLSCQIPTGAIILNNS